MSKAQDRLAQQMLDAYNAAVNRALTPSAYENVIGGQVMDTLNWAKGGDYTKPPKGIFFNMIDPAEVKRQRETIAGAGAQGIYGLGGGTSSPVLALDKANRDDEFAQNTAENYQTNVSNAISGATGEGLDLSRNDTARKQAVLGTSAGLENTALGYALKPKGGFWNTLKDSFANSLGRTLGGGR